MTSLISNTLTGVNIVASSSDSNYMQFLMIASPIIVFIVVYRLIYRYYRNQDKRHKYEHTTKSVVTVKQQVDEVLRSFSGVQNSRVEGDNTKTPFKRL